MEKIKVSLSRSGVVCLWERGGGYSNTGNSTIIADAQGEPKKPIYIKRKGDLACGEHALIPVWDDDIIVRASHHRGDFDIDILKIMFVNAVLQFATVATLNKFSMGEWEAEVDQQYLKCCRAAIDKANIYHCREAIYVKDGENG